jgi:hypothetical protein
LFVLKVVSGSSSLPISQFSSGGVTVQAPTSSSIAMIVGIVVGVVVVALIVLLIVCLCKRHEV